MTAPIPNCPQPETPIRERAWTYEQLYKRKAFALDALVAIGDIPISRLNAALAIADAAIGATP